MPNRRLTFAWYISLSENSWQSITLNLYLGYPFYHLKKYQMLFLDVVSAASSSLKIYEFSDCVSDTYTDNYFRFLWAAESTGKTFPTTTNRVETCHQHLKGLFHSKNPTVFVFCGNGKFCSNQDCTQITASKYLYIVHKISVEQTCTFLLRIEEKSTEF